MLANLAAAHSSRQTCELIGGKEGWDYLITLMTDKLVLYREAAEKIRGVAFGPPHDVMTENRRGRTKTWSCWIKDVKSIDHPYLEQVSCIRCEVFNPAGEKLSKEIALEITSASSCRMTAADANRHARNHWGIENKSHYVRDTTYQEDKNQSYSGNGPQALASIHNLALGLLRLKGVTSIKETTETIHLNLIRSLHYMTTERNFSCTALPANGPGLGCRYDHWRPPSEIRRFNYCMRH